MYSHQTYMNRCLELAAKGLGNVAPNPMVGCVIVYEKTIIGEGFHEEYGKAHAEVNAIQSVKDKSLLKKATLYVNLEPCSHYGKTPPCADMIIAHKIPYVVIGTIDTHAAVAGRGIKKLSKAGIDVKVGINETECKELNKRFFTFHEKKRPYIILKWAQSTDGFIDAKRNEAIAGNQIQISNSESKRLLHQWRSEEQAIMIGTNTALLDNPRLTVREITGKNPLRVTIDKKLRIPKEFYLLDKSVPTLVFTSTTTPSSDNLEFVKIDFKKTVLPQILKELQKRGILSILVEGGEQLLNSFIREGLWDEARVFIADTEIKDGVNAPVLKADPVSQQRISGDTLLIYKHA